MDISTSAPGNGPAASAATGGAEHPVAAAGERRARIRTALTGLGLLILAGCTSFGGSGGSQGVDPAAADGAAAGGYEYDTRGAGADSYGYSDAGGIEGQSLGGGVGPQAGSVGRVIYFDYDSDRIRDESRPVIEAHARYLADNPAVSVLLEGHTDERGTREYNIALGERRGQSVRQVLTGLGVQPQQLSVVSYGEERPTANGQDEYSFAQNRRVEFAY